MENSSRVQVAGVVGVDLGDRSGPGQRHGDPEFGGDQAQHALDLGSSSSGERIGPGAAEQDEIGASQTLDQACAIDESAAGDVPNASRERMILTQR